MTPAEPEQLNAPPPKGRLDDRELVLHWANLPGRFGPKTAASILHYMKSIDGFRNSAGKPFFHMTVADITRYVDGGSSINALSKLLKFLTWAYTYGHITVDLAYAYEHRNPHIVKTDKAWETQDEAVFEDWVATCKVKNPTTRELYRKSIMELRSYFDKPLSTLTPADVMVMNVSLNDRGIGVRFTQWLARRSIAVAAPDVPDPVSPVDSVPEWLLKLENTIRQMLNFQAGIEAVTTLWSLEFGRIRTAQTALEARLEALETGGARSADAWPLLAERIQRLEARHTENSAAWLSLAKRMGHMESLWGRQLDERLANLDRRHAEVVAVVTATASVMHRLVKACYTGTSPIHPLDGKDLRYISDVMTDFWGRTRHWLDTSGPVRDAPVPMHPPRNGVAPALVDSGSSTDARPG